LHFDIEYAVQHIYASFGEVKPTTFSRTVLITQALPKFQCSFPGFLFIWIQIHALQDQLILEKTVLRIRHPVPF